MTGSIVEFSERLDLSALQWQWDHGDPLALMEAIALCAEQNLAYPSWVRQPIDQAFGRLYRAVYPDLPPGGVKLERGERPERSQIAKDFAEAKIEALRGLGLAANRAQVLERRYQTLRDIELAAEVELRCRFVRNSKPRFIGVNKAIRSLEAELGDPDRRRAYPRECHGASEDTIKRAWSRHKASLLETRSDLPDDLTGPPDD
jgi:hypothetical protein